MIRAAIILFIALTTTTTSAETTVCYGDGKCTVVTSSGSRQMSKREELAHRRDQQRGRVDNIECQSAKSPRECIELKTSLYRLFADQ